MAHSLAHALMTEVAIDCGYPASALKERIYVLPRVPGQPIQCGILIYTATAGNQGTLGGLVEVTRRFARVLSPHWNASAFAPAILYAPITTRSLLTRTERCMGRLATAVCWSRRRVAKRAMFSWTGLY